MRSIAEALMKALSISAADQEALQNADYWSEVLDFISNSQRQGQEIVVMETVQWYQDLTYGMDEEVIESIPRYFVAGYVWLHKSVLNEIIAKKRAANYGIEWYDPHEVLKAEAEIAGEDLGKFVKEMDNPPPDFQLSGCQFIRFNTWETVNPHAEREARDRALAEFLAKKKPTVIPSGMKTEYRYRRKDGVHETATYDEANGLLAVHEPKYRVLLRNSNLDQRAFLEDELGYEVLEVIER